ncbi:triple tyrosine motif-containing protein [Psychroflexus tropicus]|uniref:triple tyrosine motif-containing protein n=1 Tax=Psychroflexus tropicus TaxID=197345 RepID=UPI0003787581|nr:triple tyrosine motif-containing protein [Psychroflexus tropicus]
MLWSILTSIVAHSQELPPVSNFSPKDYKADNQNWSITQAEDDKIFIANNKGLLQYDGEAWTLYPSPNQSILRSVFFHEGKLYSGSYREFGYWEKSLTGQLKYFSLSEDIINSIGTDEQFWTIDRLEHWIIFQSLDNIYSYDTKNHSLRKIEIDGSITKMYKLDSDLYFQIINKGLFKIRDGKATLVSDHQLFRDHYIINLYTNDSDILVQMDTQGIVTLATQPRPWPDSTSSLSDFTVYTSLQKKNGQIVLGTISQGVVFLSANGTIESNITQQETLENNTVLSIYEDNDENIWLGLDNGINCIHSKAPLRVFKDDKGVLGTVYTSVVYQDKLYLGTNQGLFYRPLPQTAEEFKLVEGSNGQVWNLKLIGDDLLCGHNNGTFILKDNRLEQISRLQGTWCFKEIPNKPNLLLQGNYKGLSVLERKQDNWQLRNRLENFELSSKFVEFSSSNQVLIDHEYKGVYKVKLDSNYTRVESVQQFEELNKSLYSSILKFNDEIYYAQQNGISKYNPKLNQFKTDTLLSKMYDKNSYSSGKLVMTDGEVSLWSFNENSINITLQGKIDNRFRLTSIPISSGSRNTMSGYENVQMLDNNQYLIGSTQGYMILDFDQFLKTRIEKTLAINSVSYWENGEPHHQLNLENPSELKNKTNNISFRYSIPYYNNYFAPEYQYRLKGFLEEWSEWSKTHESSFNNLPFGDYEFQVRARVGELYESDLKTFEFKVKRPFIVSNSMIIVYVFIFIILSFLVHSAYKQYYKRQKEKLKHQANRELELKDLENQKELMQVKNEKLKQDIENKSRELAVSTMSLIKKNEFLGSIKDELQKAKPVPANAKKVIKIIDKNINNTDDWKMFEEAFNNADKDFLKTMKTKHPSLTPNDLRLSAYLRLNLSSKEIAPLFNISTKSVEVKRYRLRKKMDLSRDVSLTDYILNI